MVYIHLNQKILTLLPKFLPKSIYPLIIQNKKYLIYKDFKKLVKKLKIELHKYIHRKDIIPQAQINRKIQLSRRSPVEKKVIEQLKNRQQFKKNNPSLSDQISFLYNEAVYQVKNDKISDQVYSGSRFIFSICMTALVGYLIAKSGFGLSSLWSFCVSGLSSGSVYFLNTMKNRTNGSFSNQKSQKQIHKSKNSSPSISFGKERPNSTTISSKGKMKRQ